jgi:C4-dicarboxylate-specific signal transduction histidine kinase
VNSGAIAHEVNQPLTAILSNAQAALFLLEQESPNSPDATRCRISQEDNRAGEVVLRLRACSEGRDQGEPVDLNELVNQTTTLFRTMIGRRIVSRPAMAGDPVQPYRCRSIWS